MRTRTLLAVALLLAPLAAQAERYRVDLIVFRDLYPSSEQGRDYQPPPPTTAPVAGVLELNDPRAAAAGIEVLPEAQFGLADLWQKLRGSRRYQPLVRLAWLQDDPPAERSLALRLRHGAPLTLLSAGVASAPAYPLEGSVALRLSHYLYLDADLAWVEPVAGGKLGAVKLKEVRRMKRDEVHHLDSPRLGILARVQKAAPAAATPAAQPVP